jgi:hypothetical protein
MTCRPTAAVAPSGLVWRARGRGIVSCPPEPFGGGVGGALELLEPSQVRRAAAVEPGPIEVEALAVVARLGAQLAQPRRLAVGHGRWRRYSRSASAARFIGVKRRAFDDPW